jgi:hypothetical protein
MIGTFGSSLAHMDRRLKGDVFSCSVALLSQHVLHFMPPALVTCTRLPRRRPDTGIARVALFEDMRDMEGSVGMRSAGESINHWG